MKRSVTAAVPVAVSATNRRVPAESFGWAAYAFLVLLIALVAAGVVAAVAM